MKKHIFSYTSFCYIVFIISILFFTSCAHSKKITYFQDLKDTAKIYSQAINGTYEPKIQPDDVLGISVNSINPEATAIFNMQGNNASQLAPLTNAGAAVNTNSGENNAALNGYLVNKKGEIEFPVLGKLEVTGLTTSQLSDTLKGKLDQYLKDPIVNVRLLNYKVTVLGEVNRPSTYSITSERITVVDAIGMAGDLTIDGKRENVLLIREENGERKFIRLDLNSSTLFESPYYYLKQNDIVYVETSKSRAQTSAQSTFRFIAITISVLSLALLTIYRFGN
jgi:polysaccharide export outer membrane protein